MSNLVWIFKEIFYLGATASILILIILLIKKIFGKALNPKWHYYIWVLLFIKLLIPFYTESSISVYNLFYTAAEKVNMHIGEIGVPFKGNSLNENSTNTKVVSSTHAITDINNVNTANDDNIKVTKSPKYSSAMLIIAFIWVIGVLMLSFYIIYINIAFTINVNRKYTLLKNERIRTILEDCKNAMKVKYPISLLTSKEIRMPSLYGLFKAKILISESYMDKLSDTEIRYIFLHELSHYKGKDIAINGILCLLQIIYFFNPLIWYAFYKIHEDCEISCDAAALRYIDEAEYNNYGSTIIKLIRLFSESNFIPLTAGISKKNSSYKRRIIMINKFKKSKWTSSLLAVILIISTGLVGLTGCNLSKDEDSNTNTMTSSNSTNNTKNQTTTDGTNSPDFNTSDSTKPNETSKPRDTDTTNPSQTTTAAAAQATPEAKPAPAVQASEAKPAPTKEVFYGQWTIKKVLAYGSAGTYSTEDAKSLLGKSLNFSEHNANYFGDEPSFINKVASNPVYKKADISKSYFVTNYHMTFDKLDIKSDYISEITASDSKGTSVCGFLIKDRNTLILFGGGTYFELSRKAD